MVDPLADPKTDRVSACRGRVLGGGVALKSRSLGLVLKPEHQTVMNSSRIENAVNKRFHTFQNGIKIGVAKAKTEEYVELTVHPRYKENIARYVQVVRCGGDFRIGLPSAWSELPHWNNSCSSRPLRPRPRCNWRRIGQDGVPSLIKGP